MSHSLTRQLKQTLLHTRPSSLSPSSAPLVHSRASSSSWSFSSLRDFLPNKKRQQDSAADKSAKEGEVVGQQEAGKGLFDAAVEDESVRGSVVKRAVKQPTFHKSSTANFKHSRRKLNDLGRLIAGRTVDESILQLTVSPKGPASRLLSMLALARDHAIAKGLSRDKLVVAQSWTTQGPSLTRLDIKGRGRHGVKHHPSSKLHVLLAEGQTKEEKRREHKKDGWRRSIRGLTEGDGVGIGRSRPIINVGMGGWKW